MRRTSIVLVISGLAFLGCAKETPLEPFSNASAFRRGGAVPDTGGGGGGGGGNQFHAVFNGSFGSVNWSGGAGDSLGGGGGANTVGFLTVSQGGSPGHPQVYLNYAVLQCDFSGCNTIAGGYGAIPSGDFSGGGAQMRLSTNTSADPDFFVYAGAGGPVSVQWRADGFSTSRSTGVSDLIYGGFAQHTQGTYSSASATATGSVIGFLISAAQSGSIGQNQNVSLNITTH